MHRWWEGVLSRVWVQLAGVKDDEPWEHGVWERTAYALDEASESNSKMQPLSGGKNLKALLGSEFDYVTNYHCDLRKASSPFWPFIFLICPWVAGHMAAQLTSWLPVACLGTVLGCALSQESFDFSRHATDSLFLLSTQQHPCTWIVASSYNHPPLPFMIL